MKHCSKCNDDIRLEEHHFFPKVHYGNGYRNRHTITLCRFCHMKIEFVLLSCESYAGNVKFGTRYKLSREDYLKIHRNWLKDSKILNINFA